MSEYYNAKRKKNLYAAGESFKISRSKIEDFIRCPRCFWLDRVKGIGQPPGYPFSLNSAVDTLLKKEFDIYRAAGEPHPLMLEHKLKMIPFAHKDLETWRTNFKGIQVLHKKTNLMLTGAVDDLWITTEKKPKIVVVDYKATSKTSEVSLDADWQDGYKRQMEIYQWLLRQLGFEVSDTGYFVYANGITARDRFDARLEFELHLLPHKGDDSWVEKTILALKNCLDGPMPECSEDCDFCAYHEARK